MPELALFSDGNFYVCLMDATPRVPALESALWGDIPRELLHLAGAPHGPRAHFAHHLMGSVHCLGATVIRRIRIGPRRQLCPCEVDQGWPSREWRSLLV